jgi:DNA-binding CsgD family transcriptional regulator
VNGRAAEPASTASTSLERLSEKERACLRLVARHLSSKQIAGELGIAKTSVDTYCDRARAKLGVADRYEAARLLESEPGPRASRPADRGGAARPGLLPTPRSKVVIAASILLAMAILLAGLRAVEAMKPSNLRYHPSPHDLAAAHVHGG